MNIFNKIEYAIIWNSQQGAATPAALCHPLRSIEDFHPVSLAQQAIPTFLEAAPFYSRKAIWIKSNGFLGAGLAHSVGVEILALCGWCFPRKIAQSVRILLPDVLQYNFLRLSAGIVQNAGVVEIGSILIALPVFQLESIQVFRIVLQSLLIGLDIHLLMLVDGLVAPVEDLDSVDADPHQAVWHFEFNLFTPGTSEQQSVCDNVPQNSCLYFGLSQCMLKPFYLLSIASPDRTQQHFYLRIQLNWNLRTVLHHIDLAQSLCNTILCFCYFICLHPSVCQ